ncbi:MAG: beta-ketoacyl-[acyl-carrier-protein] synthase family protein [Symbiobacterium sp.]|uniref:beta-ketoacyl-[acyl-carrier-protein] synthase family protein n=1 Tax=Symbiobacterium sp. TaxID=1971213 RepID=UPI003464C633
MERVVITGLGVISPIGIGQAAYVDALRRGVCGAGPITSFDTTGYRTAHGCEAGDFVTEPVALPDGSVERDRAALLALAAAEEAAEDAGLAAAGFDPWRLGVVMATSLGGILCMDQYLTDAITVRQPADPSLFLHTCPSITGVIAQKYGARGPTITVSTACAAGTNSVGYAFDLVRTGRCTAVLCGGTDPFTRLSFSGFNSLKSLSRGLARPFSRDRDGLVLGEAAAVLVLESLSSARARGARIYAEVLGYGISNDAYHATSPDPKGGGAVRAIRACLQEAGLTPDDVDYINAHGTATKLNDGMELRAIVQVFGERASRIPISSTKSLIGHTLGCAGSIEALTCALAIAHEFLPPTINLSEPVEGYEAFDFVRESRPCRINVALSNSFAFAGNVAVIALGRCAA